jgi:hypothetical protein
VEDLVITDGEWFRTVDAECPGVLCAVADVQSVFHPLAIDGWTGVVADDAALAQIEVELARLFSL